MNKERNQTISTRAISTTFVIVALAVFKPFGLDTWQWQAYVHLAVLWIIGISICMLTGLILKYVVRMPRSYEKGVEYVIRRNLWFQLINTPLVALSVCFYRHFVLSNGTENNQLSVINFIESLLIIAFCSFTIGLYWRFKFRSKFLKVELEETKQLNDQLTKVEKVEREEVAEKGGELVRYKVKELRLARGMTQEELSRKSGVSRQIISNLENDDITVTSTNTLARIARALDAKVSDIFLD